MAPVTLRRHGNEALVRQVLLVGLGGGLGSAGRYLIDRAYGSRDYPLATLTVNLAGSLALGFLAGWLAHRLAPDARLALFTGVLGGFTTFSTLALETSVLFRSGSTGSSIAYLAVSVVAGVGLAAVGLIAGEAIA